MICLAHDVPLAGGNQTLITRPRLFHVIYQHATVKRPECCDTNASDDPFPEDYNGH